MVWNEIPSVFLLCEMVKKGIPSTFIFRGMVPNKIMKFRVFFFSENGSKRNSELFYLLRNVSERIFDHFRYCRTQKWIKFPSLQYVLCGRTTSHEWKVNYEVPYKASPICIELIIANTLILYFIIFDPQNYILTNIRRKNISIFRITEQISA
jgi:hypothetical protein